VTIDQGERSEMAITGWLSLAGHSQAINEIMPA
jgi:hypothetical protein